MDLNEDRNKLSRRRSRVLWSVALCALVVLVLLGSATGAFASLVDTTSGVKEHFLTAKLDCDVTGPVPDEEGNSVYTVKNIGDIPGFVRVTLVANFVDQNGDIVFATVPEISVSGKDWTKIQRDELTFYCYNGVVPGGASVELPIQVAEAQAVDDATLQVYVLSDIVQTTPQTAVEEAWGVRYVTDGAEKTWNKIA